MARRLWGLFVLGILVGEASGKSVPEKPPVPAVVAAKDTEIKQISDAWTKGVTDKSDEILEQALLQMETKRNDAFVPFIRIGMKSKDIKVTTAALRAAASHDLKDLEKDVRKLLKAKTDKTQVAGGRSAAAVDYLVRLNFGGEEAFVHEELLVGMFKDDRRMRASWGKDMARAAIHYLGQFKYKPAAKQLIEMVGEPVPENVNSGSNPPASYWEARWKLWEVSESWVRWALKEITGQEFRSPREWREWLEKNKKDYGG